MTPPRPTKAERLKAAKQEVANERDFHRRMTIFGRASDCHDYRTKVAKLRAIEAEPDDDTGARKEGT